MCQTGTSRRCLVMATGILMCAIVLLYPPPLLCVLGCQTIIIMLKLYLLPSWLSLSKHSRSDSNVMCSGWTLCCAVLHKTKKGRKAGESGHSADTLQIGDFDFVDNQWMRCCLLNQGSLLEQAMQLLTDCVIVFHRFRLCPGPEMKRPIKVVGTVGWRCVGCSYPGSVQVTESGIIIWPYKPIKVSLVIYNGPLYRIKAVYNT